MCGVCSVFSFAPFRPQKLGKDVTTKPRDAGPKLVDDPAPSSAPAGLAARGETFWLSTMAENVLTGAELELLTEVARTMDDLDMLAAAIVSGGATVTGSQGQQVINPALTEARGQRQVLHRLLAALALPDDDGAVLPSVEKLRARKAAASRWSDHRARRLAAPAE